MEPADVEVCEQLAEVQAKKARTNAIENATSALLAKKSPRWEVYEHTCQGSEGDGVITSVSRDQLRHLVAAILNREMLDGRIYVENYDYNYIAHLGTDGTELIFSCDCSDDRDCRLSLAFID